MNTDKEKDTETRELVLQPQPVPSFANRAGIDCGEWSASGGPRCEDCEEDSLYD